MARSRNTIRAFALSALVLGLMAVAASSAQAKPDWMVSGVDITSNTLLPEVQVKEIEKGTGSLLAKVGTVSTEILCKAATLIEVKLAAGGTLTHGKARFTGCETYLNGVLSLPCEPYTELDSSTIHKGVIETNKFKGVIVLHEPSAGVKKAMVLIQPLNGGDDSLVNILLGEECSIGENLPVLGELVLEDCLGFDESEKVEHLIQENKALTKLFVIDLKAERAATLDGSAWVRMANPGPHQGMTWRALAA